MVVTRYKPLFSLTATYELPAIGITAEGLIVEDLGQSSSTMIDLKLRPQYKNNTATVFYEGYEKPVNAPTTCEPSLIIDSDKYFYFSLTLSSKEKIKLLKLHSSTAIAKEIGFPLLYDAFVPVLNGAATVTAREDVKIISPLFTLAVPAIDTGVASEYATLEIRDEKNVLVDLKIEPVKVNDKSIDGLAAVPEFAFSVDASSVEAGVYEFKIGNFKKKYFLAVNMDISKTVSIIRVLKNNFLEYKKNLNDNGYAKFSLLIPKV